MRILHDFYIFRQKYKIKQIKYTQIEHEFENSFIIFILILVHPSWKLQHEVITPQNYWGPKRIKIK